MERDAAIVLNHMRGLPSTTFEGRGSAPTSSPTWRATSPGPDAARLAAGIRPDRILLDPGFGFGKTPDQNFALLAGLALLAPEGAPVVVGASRKAFLGSLSGRPPAERLPESLAACAAAARGSRGRNPLLLRVHDVEETVRFLAVLGRVVTPSPT